MRGMVLVGLLALGACATSAPPERIFPVFFNDFSTTLDPPALVVVARAAAVSKAHPGKVVHVAGYADASSSNDVIQLSKSRADVVSQQLQADGVPAALIERAAGGSPPDSQPGIERRRVEISLDI